MDFLTIAQVAGTGLKIASALQGGRDTANQAAQDQYSLQMDMNQQAIVGRQKMNLRNAQFAANESINRATFFSGLNRDPSDRSVRAFLAKQRELAGEDVTAIQGQTSVSLGMKQVQVAALGRRAESAYTAALLGAGSAVASGLYRYDTYRTEDSLFDIG